MKRVKAAQKKNSNKETKLNEEHCMTMKTREVSVEV